MPSSVFSPNDYFSVYSLPWQGLKAATKKQKYDKICEKKLSTPIEVCANYLCALSKFYMVSIGLTAVFHRFYANLIRWSLRHISITATHRHLISGLIMDS